MTPRDSRRVFAMAMAFLGGCLLHLSVARAASWQNNAQLLYRHLGRLHWIAEGRGPKVLYDFIDLNAPNDHALFTRLAPLLSRDHLVVRQLLVGYLKTSSAGKAAAILQSRDPRAALARAESRFSAQGAPVAPIPVRPATQRILQANFQALTALEGNPWMRMAPLLVYRSQTGHVHVFQGYLTSTRLAAIIGRAGP